MKRPVLTGDQNRRRIAGEGAKAAKAKFEASRSLIRQAMRDIETDIEKSDGIYPFAGRGVSAAEVLRRAGKSEAYLRKKEPSELIELKDEVEAWVDRVTQATAGGVRVVRKNITDRIRAAQDELRLVRQAYAETELELSEAQVELQNAEKTIGELRAENTILLKKLTDKTVVDLDTRRK